MGTEPTPDVETKECAKCKQVKPLTEFNNNSASKDGKQRYCRVCNKGYGRNYYKKVTAPKREKDKTDGSKDNNRKEPKGTTETS